jgi:ABC-type nitrate/sulfonate/bicarbonate transport system substrate-binding protein
VKLRLTLACGDYDRTRALRDGEVQPEGIDLTYLALPVEETFFRMLRYREFEVAEMSLSSYTASLFGADPSMIAIPVFTSRAFRHSGVFINRASGIREPEDLKGKIVGNPEFELTACVWMRGILADHHGVPADSVRYVTGGLEQVQRREKLHLELPERFDVAPIGGGTTLSEALVKGDIDALYTPRAPSAFDNAAPEVARLWPDSQAAEEAYFAATQIFPIMHTVVLRRDVYERAPWVARSLLKAFIVARDRAYEQLRETSALSYMVPWLPQQNARAIELMGEDFWSYGLDANRKVLETFLGYHHEQGLSPRRLQPEELFADETFEAFAI